MAQVLMSTVPVDRVLVHLGELPVHGVNVQVVVLLKVLGEQVQGVIARMEPTLVLMDLLHLRSSQKDFHVSLNHD